MGSKHQNWGENPEMRCIVMRSLTLWWMIGWVLCGVWSRTKSKNWGEGEGEGIARPSLIETLIQIILRGALIASIQNLIIFSNHKLNGFSDKNLREGIQVHRVHRWLISMPLCSIWNTCVLETYITGANKKETGANLLKQTRVLQDIFKQYGIHKTLMFGASTRIPTSILTSIIIFKCVLKKCNMRE